MPGRRLGAWHAGVIRPVRGVRIKVSASMGGGCPLRTGNIANSRPTILAVALDLRSANPAGVAPGELALDHELADIWHELRVMAPRHDFEVVTARAATVDDLMWLLMKLKPTVLHLAGHGVAGGLGAPATAADCRDVVPTGADCSGVLLLDRLGRPQPVPARGLAQMITSTAPGVRLLLLNACYSEVQAEVLSGVVDSVITMNGAIRDDSARSFAVAFYRGLGHRESVAVAFAQAKAALAGKGCPDADLPTIHTRSTGDLVLASPQGGFSVQPRSAEFDSGKVRQVVQRHAWHGCIVSIALALVALATAAHLLAFLQAGPQPSSGPDRPAPTVHPANADHDPAKSAALAVEPPPSPAPQPPPRPAPQPPPHPAPQPPPSPAPPPPGGQAPGHAMVQSPAALPQPGQEARSPHAAAPSPRATPLDDPRSLGELDRDTARRYIGYHVDQIRHCYESRRMAKPDLKGKVFARFDITPGGNVASATAIGLDSTVAGCVADAIKDIEFPRSSAGVHVNYLFQFQPADTLGAPVT